jgi:hypothetical protein
MISSDPVIVESIYKANFLTNDGDDKTADKF